MNYLKLYYRLIESRKHLIRDVYQEIHHIVPRSVFGMSVLPEDNLSHINDRKNLVALTPREHFICHWILARAFPNNKQLVGAFWAMSNFAKPDGKKRNYIVSSRTFEEARKIFSESKFKPIIQYSLNGEFIKIYESRMSASEELGLQMSGFGKSKKTNGGYLWRDYSDDFPKKIKPHILKFANKPIIQISPDGSHFVNRFISAKKAADELNISFKHISSCCHNLRSTTGGYRWVFEDEYDFNLPMAIEDDSYYQKLAVIISKEKTSIAKFRAVAQYNLNGEFINIFSSIIEASKKTNTNRISIGNCCSGKIKSANNFIWRYFDGTPELTISKFERKIREDSYKVGQYDLSGKLIKVHENLSAVDKIADKSSVYDVITGRSKSSFGFMWRKYEGDLQIPPLKYETNRGRKVVQKDKKNGVVINTFDSLTSASEITGYSKSGISKVLNGERKSAFGFKWEY